MSLKQLLDQLLQPASRREYEHAWLEFLRRYRRFMEDKIIQRCYFWNSPRLSLQFTDAANDVLGDVLEYLCKDNAKKLRDFRNTDNEYKFLSWLGMVCNQAVSRHMRKHIKSEMSEVDLTQDSPNDDNWLFIKRYMKSLSADTRWEMYEYIVAALRGANPKRPPNLERDIHIYLLYDWADFNYDMIFKVAYFDGLGHRVIDNVVYRMREQLRKNMGDDL